MLIPNPMGDVYYSFGTVPEGLIWQWVNGRERRILVPPQEIVIDRRRLRVYLHKGKRCTACARIGIEWHVQTDVKDQFLQRWYWNPYEAHRVRTHLNLFGVDPDGTVFMMTVDHILPKSKGGSWSLENLQPMCERCNRQKGDSNDDEFFARQVGTVAAKQPGFP